MASRIIAQLIAAGSAVMVRAVVQAYNQALQNAARNGGAASQAASAASRFSARNRKMGLDEAYKVLGVESSVSIEEVCKKAKTMMEANEKAGSFYLQSKVYRAQEAIENSYRNAGNNTSEQEES